jgi:hypothetical protein
MTFLYISFGWVFGIGFWAKPLISNRKFGELNPSPSQQPG